MKICLGNKLEELKKIVQEKAKYQKVMLLFDDSVSNLEILEIYNEIKDFCVYNQSNINSLKETEIFNGYRLIIYYCLVDNFLKCNFDRSEFINVYMQKDGAMLPYFLTKNSTISQDENFLLLENKKIDLSMLTSVCFNRFYNYFRNLIIGNNQFSDLGFSNMEITQTNVINSLNEFNTKSVFVDIELLKKQNIDYELIVFVDLMIIDAILLLITSIKNQNVMLVDIYKSFKDDCDFIDKFYKLYHDETLLNIITLNYNCLYNYCLKTKQKIMEYAKYFQIESKQVPFLLNQIKLYSKNDNDIMAYLYLYNIFNV